MRNARLLVGRSQEYVASRIGIERSTLTNYEAAITPVRWEVALRFCRYLIVSEEWLATGTTTMAQAAVENRPTQLLEKKLLPSLLVRQCMDLLSDPITIKLRPGAAFSTAFDDHLATRYQELLNGASELPRIAFSHIPEVDLAEELVACMAERWMKLLSYQAAHYGQNAWLLQRGFIRRWLSKGDKVFWDYCGGPGAAYHSEVELAKHESEERDSTRRPAPKSPHEQKSNNVSSSLLDTKAGDVVFIPDMKLKSVQDLVTELERLSKKFGSKAALARKLNVSRQAVDQWLNGKTTPSADIAIKVMNLK